MKYYKLTDAQGQTHGGTQWGEGVTHTAKGKGNDLCTDAVIHVYDHPLMAVLFNSIHADISNPLLWECTIRRKVADDGTKIGVKVCTTIRQIDLPVVTTAQRVRWAILCALEVYSEPEFVRWANDWLSGKDRSPVAAWAARAATTRAAWAAATRAAWAAATRAAWAAEAVGAAGAAAAEAAARAAAAEGKLDLLKLAQQAIAEEQP